MIIFFKKRDGIPFSFLEEKLVLKKRNPKSITIKRRKKIDLGMQDCIEL
jgi:hypothetical protein